VGVGTHVCLQFTKQPVIDTYTAFINNWKSAKRAVRTATQCKPAFAKYLDRCSRDHKNKLTLDALLIMPVQRIPRYELLIKELLKHTSVEHADHALLLRAQKEIHELATKIDHMQQEQGANEQMLQRLREIEAIVDGLDDLVAPARIYHRYDLVFVNVGAPCMVAHARRHMFQTHAGSKERCMFVFSDLLLITSVKRKSNTSSKKLTTAHDFLENHKFKLLMKCSLDDVDIARSG
jgi:hypothetical protein